MVSISPIILTLKRISVERSPRTTNVVDLPRFLSFSVRRFAQMAVLTGNASPLTNASVISATSEKAALLVSYSGIGILTLDMCNVHASVG